MRFSIDFLNSGAIVKLLKTVLEKYTYKGKTILFPGKLCSIEDLGNSELHRFSTVVFICNINIGLHIRYLVTQKYQDLKKNISKTLCKSYNGFHIELIIPRGQVAS